MNFLGHCLFSEASPSALMGSLWPDFGKRPSPGDCSAVFNLHFDRHQNIDKITDQHEILESLRQELRPTFRKTTPIIVDMMLDHHLAKHWSNFQSQPLESFAQQTYQQLAQFDEFEFNERFERSFYWMQKQNWLVSYRSEQGIMRALSGMSQRIRFKNPIAENLHLVPEQTVAFEEELGEFIGYLVAEFEA